MTYIDNALRGRVVKSRFDWMSEGDGWPNNTDKGTIIAVWVENSPYSNVPGTRLRVQVEATREGKPITFSVVLDDTQFVDGT